MKQLLTALALLAGLLAGCGGPIEAPDTPASAVTSGGSASVPAVRSLFPADFAARGLPDAMPHPSMRRIMLQAPPSAEPRLTRGDLVLAFHHNRTTLADGTTLHQLELEEPLGERPAILRVGEYVLSLVPDMDAGLPAPDIRPRTAGAMADDLANARSALFPSVNGVSLLLRGELPRLEALSLRSGSGAAVPMRLSMAADGIVAEVLRPLEADRVYHVYATSGDTAEPLFALRCLGSPDRRAVQMLRADLNRNGEPELLCLYADSALDALTAPDQRARALLPGSDSLALGLAAGDFTGNGATDIAVLLRDAGTSRVLRLENLTQADGLRFSLHSESLATTAAIAIAAADFDRDGRDDIAVLDAFGEVLIHFAGGGFKRVPALHPRMLACGMHVADFSGDGKPDLFVYGADGIGWLLLNGGGTFALTEIIAVPRALQSATGDLDGDRCADLVLTGRRAELLVVNGAYREAFTMPLRTESLPRLAGAVLCRDVNRDSRSDIIVALEDEHGLSDEIALFLNADGRERALRPGEPDAVLPLGARLRINGMEWWRRHLMLATDAGLLMLKVNAEELPPKVDSAVLFEPAYTPIPRIPSPLSAAIADFNDDGRADIAAVDSEGRLQVWLAAAVGAPFELSGDAIELGGPGTLQAIDFDRDNFPDLLYIPQDPRLQPRLLRNDRRGRFYEDQTGVLPLPPPSLRGAPAMGDFDRDGDLDVLWPSPLGRIQYNEGGGRWRDSRAELNVRDDRNMRLQFSGELCCADFTRNGIADIVAVMQPGENFGPQYLVLWVGTGSTSDDVPPFVPVVTTALPGQFFGLAPADFTGDGALDLALGYAPEGQEPRLTLLRLGADLKFEIIEGTPQARGTLLDLAMDDLDRDGRLDLISTERIGDAVETTLWINSGNGRFVRADAAQRRLADALGGFRAVNLSLADFTGDGRPDLLAIDADGNVVIVRTTLP